MALACTCLCWILVLVITTVVHKIHGVCQVSMNGGLPYPEPLILLPGGSRDVFGFKLPTAGRTLVFSEGEKVRLVCAGPDNFFQSLATRPQDIIASCTGGSFTHASTRQPLASFNCSRVSESSTRLTDTPCNEDRDRLIEIGFDVDPGHFLTIVTVCFDESQLNSVWSRFDLVSSIRDGEIGLERPFFQPGPHYHGLNPDVLYTRNTQRKTLGKIVGVQNANLFIPRSPPDSRLYLSRGHLTASADFVYNALKLATYYFINVAPQWYSFNDGTWRDLENGVRYFAHSRRLDLVVFTGTHDVDTLPDASGNEHKFYLDYDGRSLPVPAVFWKVVYDPVTGKGIAFVGVNNPHRLFDYVDNDERYQLCEKKISSRVWWICKNYQPEYQEQGFGYCCEVDDFRRTVTSLPPFSVTGVLE